MALIVLLWETIPWKNIFSLNQSEVVHKNWVKGTNVRSTGPFFATLPLPPEQLVPKARVRIGARPPLPDAQDGILHRHPLAADQVGCAQRDRTAHACGAVNQASGAGRQGGDQLVADPLYQ